ncbi:hypothetical protein AB0O01_00040 [Streptomyces sp. NPDC093252]|uniref:hypothetical protein n=1 Tax=Streptomyces sp. NPDC093252 TaxID=3154980 RepID=UPI00341CE4F2
MSRPASDLPGDPAGLRLLYTHGHPAVPYEDEDTLEQWRVSIHAFHEEDEECEGGCTEACDALIEDGSEVGYLRLWRLRDDTGANRLLVADGQSGDLESIAARVFDGAEYSDAFQEIIECPVGDLLILDRVFLSKPWRGFGLGPVFAAEAVRRLSGGCCAVAAEPGIAEWPENEDEVTDAYRATAKAKIAALWESIGFHAFQDGVQLLDTSMQEPLDLHEERRKDLEHLSAAFRAHRDGRPAPPARQHRAVHILLPSPAPEPAQAVDGTDDLMPLAAAASMPDLQQRCTTSGWSRSDRTTAMDAAQQATHTTDLRELAAQVKDVHFGLRDAWAAALTFPARCFTLRPFRQDRALLGPLADVWVYGSNLNGRYQGRSHAVGDDCQHSRPLNQRTQRMTLAELVDLDSFWSHSGPGCSFCHGWSGQRLTPLQYAHYLSVLAGGRR